MTAATCAWCKAHSNMTIVSPAKGDAIGGLSNQQWVQAAFSCDNCLKLSVGSTIVGLNLGIPNGLDARWWNDKRMHWTPEKVGGREFPDVPSHIASAADEAYKCQTVEAHRAAILLARSVIEATCKDKGVTKGQLAAKIDAMTDGKYIRPFTQDAAHELRHLGNDMAHGDFVEPIDADDADAVLEVMAEILNEVYQGPARVGRMREKRQRIAK